MSFTLLHYSDPHFGACDSKIAETAITFANELAPDYTVISGDFSMRGRRREFQAAREWLAQLPSPKIVFPGNHDVPGLNDIWDRFFTPFKRFRDSIHPDLEPSDDLGTLGHIVTANSSTPFGWHKDWSRGFLGPLQGNRIESEFKALPSDQLRVFGMHHPLLGAKDKERALVSPLPLVTNLLANAAVDLVLTGHFHQSKIGLFPKEPEKRHAVVSQAPSICSTRLKGEPNGCHVIEISPGEIAITLWQWDGHQFAEKHRKRFEALPHGWGEISDTENQSQ
jgi:3',5'-cyclic AMP phosphodiesterase CpdA